MAEERLTPDRKSLLVNLDERIYGTFAEIGAGQEVARYFFRVGGAAGTIAKTMSAYDMKFSDEIYGKCARYVSRERLVSMLDHEYLLLLERLSAQRGGKTLFFVFADTVAAQSFRGTRECHGWMGVRFQLEPGAPPNEVVMHVRMLDRENILQQQALGAVGVNLIHSAFFQSDNIEEFIVSLLDGLSPERLEIDLIDFSGPLFKDLDNRAINLMLVQHRLTNAIMISPDSKVIQPSESLYNKAVLIERGSFQPVTHIHIDMLDCAKRTFATEPDVKGRDLMVLAEISFHNLLTSGALNVSQVLSRVDTLGALGWTVLISDYPEFYRLISYVRRYTKELIGVAMGLNTLLQLFNEKFYGNLEGGILEALGRTFRHEVRLYIYPMSQKAFRSYIANTEVPLDPAFDPKEEVISADALEFSSHLTHLYRYLQTEGWVVPLTGYKREFLDILGRDVAQRISNGDPSWEGQVPGVVAKLIKDRKLFGLP